MYSFGLPILEFSNNKAGLMLCPKCKIPYLHGESKEEVSYFIGNHRIVVVCDVIKAQCPMCGAHWEAENAREIRNRAYRDALTDFWEEQFLNITSAQQIAETKFLIRSVIEKLGPDKKRLIAAELGRWLAECDFYN